MFLHLCELEVRLGKGGFPHRICLGVGQHPGIEVLLPHVRNRRHGGFEHPPLRFGLLLRDFHRRLDAEASQHRAELGLRADICKEFLRRVEVEDAHELPSRILGFLVDLYKVALQQRTVDMDAGLRRHACRKAFKAELLLREIPGKDEEILRTLQHIVGAILLERIPFCRSEVIRPALPVGHGRAVRLYPRAQILAQRLMAA